MKELTRLSATALGHLLRQRKVSSVELTQYSLAQIKKAEPKINAFTHVLEEQALRQAGQVQARLDSGEDLPLLAGVPMAAKDLICTKGVPTTCGSKMLESFRPPYNATVIDRLEQSGAVLLGKLNMDEFAMGGSSETSCFGPTRNPWDTSRVPGGSSGGSAAAVAAGEAFYTLGSDTGGSIRQPCSFCGVSGIKPTYGAVSRFGLVAYASSLDQIGPIGRTVEDCAHALTLIGGHDPKDSTSAQQPPIDFSGSFTGSPKGLKIGIPSNYFGEGLSPAVRAAVLEAAKVLETLGATLEEFEMPTLEYAVPAYYIIACAEASSNLSRYDGVKYGLRSRSAESLGEVYLNSRSEGFGMEVKRRILLGSFVLSSGYYDAYYKKALKVRRLVQQSFFDAYQTYDMILAPCAPTTAYPIGENITDPLRMYLGDIYTVSVNLAGVPAVSVPCGFDGTGLPIGLQLIGRPFGEGLLVQAAHAYQQATGHHLQTAPEVKGGVSQ